MAPRSIRPLLATVIIVVMGPPPLGAQNSDLLGRRVAVWTACHPDAWGPCRTVKGTLADRDSMVLVLDSARSIPLDEVRGMRYRDGTRPPTREGLAIGGFLGMVAGGAIGVASADPCQGCFLDFSGLGGALAGGFVGMLVGGLIGAGVASGMEVDRWRTLNATRLGELGVPRRPIAIGAAAGYVFPHGDSPFNSRAGGAGVILRGSLAPRRNVEPFAELSVHRVGAPDDAPDAALPVDAGGETMVGVLLGTKSWLSFLGFGRVLPYYSIAVGYESARDDLSGSRLRSAFLVGVDVFSSPSSHVFVESRYVVDTGALGLFGGAKSRV